mgnify:CR=1 FL=1
MVTSKQKYLKKVGEQIIKARKKLGISQEELADLSKIHRTYMGRIERGESNPPIYTIYKIAKALKMKSSYILTF